MRWNREGTILAIAVADTGNAIPYGLASGVLSNRVNLTEWIISALFAIAALALYARILVPFARNTWAVLLSAGIWATAASYAFSLNHATIRERLGIGLIYCGIALAALFVYSSERTRSDDKLG